eukprot:CAMPEP_0177767152 /NCGR_PEP_ID=MMETSP0491_2-20121128/8925_1 /TAXON_ID=63592 /ORGANISM="Tetraselmis chuii, Strain PLY429" /LENGTH=522 /DNA_ID=CAMNT_0019283653 /DNA_START=265 /DNA_END=1833 /DNA_ORIENTATION=-
MTFDVGLVTETSLEQTALDAKVTARYAALREELAVAEVEGEDHPLTLHRSAHARYLRGALGQLPRGFVSLDASRPWILYWALHGLALLGAPLPGEEGGSEGGVPDGASVVAFLSSCQHPKGGFGGGPGQLPHLAPTYAAVAALVTLGSREALAAVDRPAMADFLKRMCVPLQAGGGFTVHEGGEVDVRGCFTALATAHMLGLDVQELGRLSSTPEFVRACQTYEGGLAGEPGNEAHGGYAFCGVAALALLDRLDVLDTRRLLRWAASCQGGMEGGFMGRTNKLVDGCYSWWQGGVFPILQARLTAALHSRAEMPAYLQARNQSSSETAPETVDAGDVRVTALPPVEHAEEVSKALRLRAEALLQRSEAAEAETEGADGVVSVDAQEGAAELMLQAQQAVQVSRAATELAEQLCSSAASLFPPEYSVDGAGDDGGVPPLFQGAAQQAWILAQCQSSSGGLRDKPGKSVDYYHTCYCLSGLAAAQQCPGGAVLGPPSNALSLVDPVVNVVAEKLAAARAFFADT